MSVFEKEHIMSMTNRQAWSKHLATLNARIKGFQQKPERAELEAAIDAMRAYAEAAETGGIEIPMHWMAV